MVHVPDARESPLLGEPLAMVQFKEEAQKKKSDKNADLWCKLDELEAGKV